MHLKFVDTIVGFDVLSASSTSWHVHQTKLWTFFIIGIAIVALCFFLAQSEMAQLISFMFTGRRWVATPSKLSARVTLT